MTDRQFSSLRTTGAAFFIGGAIVSLTGENFGVLSMVVGGVFLITDLAVSFWVKGGKDNQEKEEQTNDPN